MSHHRFFIIASTIAAATGANAADIERIWLTHKTNDPSKIVVNWTSPKPGVTAVIRDTPSGPSEISTHHSVLCELKSLSGTTLDQIRLHPNGKPAL